MVIFLFWALPKNPVTVGKESSHFHELTFTIHYIHRVLAGHTIFFSKTGYQISRAETVVRRHHLRQHGQIPRSVHLVAWHLFLFGVLGAPFPVKKGWKKS